MSCAVCLRVYDFAVLLFDRVSLLDMFYKADRPV